MWHEDVRPVTVDMGRLVTVAQAGAVLDLSERSVRRLIASGSLVSVRIKRRLYVTRRSLTAYVESIARLECCQHA
ncbi:helix-turn-helix domain-containing protein [Collinsella tanakaei]|nr:helix-turn-helix domain-containing protein [Collinsella tanakaei]